MNAERDAIVARVLIEERWTFVARERGASFDEISAIAGMSISDGGLGRQIAVPTLKRRARGYAERRRIRLEAAREEERQRRIDLAEIAVDTADRKLSTAADEPGAYAAALRAYERAEERLKREEAGAHVPLSRELRANDEIDVALSLVDAMRYVDASDRRHLSRSLVLEGPLKAFARCLNDGSNH